VGWAHPPKPTSGRLPLKRACFGLHKALFRAFVVEWRRLRLLLPFCCCPSCPPPCEMRGAGEGREAIQRPASCGPFGGAPRAKQASAACLFSPPAFTPLRPSRAADGFAAAQLAAVQSALLAHPVLGRARPASSTLLSCFACSLWSPSRNPVSFDRCRN